MVEFANISVAYLETDRKRAFYRTQLVEHLGHLDPNALVEIMKAMRDAYKNNSTVREVHDQLADKMLMVGGNNEVAIEQLTAAREAYDLDRPAWGRVIAQYEREQKGEK